MSYRRVMIFQRFSRNKLEKKKQNRGNCSKSGFVANRGRTVPCKPCKTGLDLGWTGSQVCGARCLVSKFMDLFDTVLQVQVTTVHFTRVSPFVAMGHSFHAITEHACLFFPLTLAPIGRALILKRPHCIGLPPCTMLSWFFQTLIASCCLCPVRYRMGGKMELGGSLQVVGDEESGEKGRER